MNFSHILDKFNHELTAEFGFNAGIVKIAVTPDLFQAIVIDLYKRSDSPNSFSFSIKDVGELQVLGIQILAREKDSF